VTQRCRGRGWPATSRSRKRQPRTAGRRILVEQRANRRQNVGGGFLGSPFGGSGGAGPDSNARCVGNPGAGRRGPRRRKGYDERGLRVSRSCPRTTRGRSSEGTASATRRRLTIDPVESQYGGSTGSTSSTTTQRRASTGVEGTTVWRRRTTRNPAVDRDSGLPAVLAVFDRRPTQTSSPGVSYASGYAVFAGNAPTTTRLGKRRHRPSSSDPSSGRRRAERRPRVTS